VACTGNLIVLQVATPPAATRAETRLIIRQALRDALAPLLDCTAEKVPLFSQVGGMLALDIADCRIGLSVSHEAGMSLGAINLDGAVGIDLMQVDLKLAWQDVARDYLGAAGYRRIAANPDADQARAFAREWVALEACLKCHAVGLQEWSPKVLGRQSQARITVLDLPTRFVGALVTKMNILK